jgi:hypothetical protein
MEGHRAMPVNPDEALPLNMLAGPAVLRDGVTVVALKF